MSGTLLGVEIAVGLFLFILAARLALRIFWYLDTRSQLLISRLFGNWLLTRIGRRRGILLHLTQCFVACLLENKACRTALNMVYISHIC